jgi:predicted amidohydrolase
VRTACSDRTLALATVAMTPDVDPTVSRERLGDVVRGIVRERPDVRLILFGEVMTERRGERLHNTQVLIDPAGEIAAVHRKFWIRNRVFTPAERRLTIADVDGAKAAILICADARSLWLLRAIRRARPDVVLASLADYGTSLRLNKMMGTFYDAWTAVANRYGEEPPLTWHGLITITDRLGRLRVHGIGREQYLVHRIPIVRGGAVRRRLRRLLAGGRLLVLIVALLGGTVATKLRPRRRPST